MDTDAQRDALVEQIVDALAAEGQFVEEVSDDPVRVALVRSCGRAAGRRRERKVQTFVTDLQDTHAQEVWIVDVEPLDPADELGKLRHARRLRAAVGAAASHDR